MMVSTSIYPAPPNLADLTWRPVDENDLIALVELAGACRFQDGGLGFLFVPEIIKERYFPDRRGAAIGAFSRDDSMVACASVHLHRDSNAQQAKMLGLVRPDLRNRGIGSYLMRWSQAQARSLLAGDLANHHVLQIATESLTESAHRLYLKNGFENVFDEYVMERDLRQAVPEPSFPPGVSITNWQPDLAEQFYQAYHAAFRERPGFPGWSADEWIAQVIENDFKPEWSFLAREGNIPLGFIIGNIDLTTEPPGGYIWQIGVVPAYRRRGLASALIVETMRRMQASGATPALLTVHINNPGAIQAYLGLGFTTIGRRARYERIVEALAVDE